jgi:hypothetical protein
MYNTSNISENERKKRLEDLLKNTDAKADQQMDQLTLDEQINIMISRGEHEFNEFSKMDKERYKREHKTEKIKEILKRNKEIVKKDKTENTKNLVSTKNKKDDIVNKNNKVGNKATAKSVKNSKIDSISRTEEESATNDNIENNDEDENFNEYFDDESEKAEFNINYRLMQEYEVPSWIRVAESNDKNSNVVETEDKYGKSMRNKQRVDYKDDFEDEEFYEDSEDKSEIEETFTESKKEADNKNKNETFVGKKRSNLNEDLEINIDESVKDQTNQTSKTGKKQTKTNKKSVKDEDLPGKNIFNISLHEN